MCKVAFPQMEELKGSALSFIAQNFTAVASLSHDLAGLADSLLSRLAKVRCFMCVCLRPPYLKYLGGKRDMQSSDVELLPAIVTLIIPRHAQQNEWKVLKGAEPLMHHTGC